MIAGSAAVDIFSTWRTTIGQRVVASVRRVVKRQMEIEELAASNGSEQEEEEKRRRGEAKEGSGVG